MFDSFSPPGRAREGTATGAGGAGGHVPAPPVPPVPLPTPVPMQVQDAGRGALAQRQWGAGVSSLCPRPPCPAFSSSLSPMGAVPRHGGVGGTSTPAWHRSVAGLIGQGLGGGRGGRSARPLLQGWVLGPWKDPMGALVSRHGVPGARGHGPLGTHEAGDLFSTQGPGLLQCRVRERCLIQRSQRWLGADADRHRHRYRPLGSLGRAVPKHPPHGRCCLCWP